MSSRSSPRRLVFVDETGVTTAMTPAYGRAPRGERVESSAPASWESVTVIAAMGLDGVRAPLAFEGAVNAATFLMYVEQVLVPALHRGDVVIFDNLASHLSPAVSEAIGRAGATVLPLPPYSPDWRCCTNLSDYHRRRSSLVLCGDHAATRSLTGIPWWVMMFIARHRMPTSLACCSGLRLATPPPKIAFIRNIAVSPSDRR